MERYLKPTIFDTDPESSTAAKEWSHWKRTLTNFISMIKPPTSSISSDDVSTGDATPVIDTRLHMLTNYVNHAVFDFISECETYDTAIDVLERLYVKPKNEIFARHLLAQRKQKPGESLDQFLQELRTLAKDCNFIAVSVEEHRNSSVRDAFISGLTSSAIRQRLLENRTLELKAAFDQARSLDVAQKSSDTYTSQQPVPVAITTSHTDSDQQLGEVTSAATKSFQSKEKGDLCYFCGNRRHPRSQCPAREVTCLKCSKIGHFAKVCKSSKLTNQQQGTAAALYLASVPNRKNPFRVSTEIIIHDTKVNALIDSGSSEKSFINHNIAKNLGLKIQPEKVSVRMAASGIDLPVVGFCKIDFSLQNRNYKDFKISVLKDLCTDVILGTDFQARHKKLIIEYGGPEPALSFCALASLKVDAPCLFSNLTPDCKPIRTKSRRYSVRDRLFIKTEVNRLLKEGIIEPSNSPWRSQVLINRDNGHQKPRMVVDYSQTINRFTQADAYPLPRIEEMVNNIAQYKILSTLDLRSAYHQIPLNEEDKAYTAFEAMGKLYQFRRMPFGVTNGTACFQRTMDNLISENKLEGAFAYVDNVTIGGDDQAEHDMNLKRFLEVAKENNVTFNEDQSVFSTTSLNLLGYHISNGSLSPDQERLKPLLDLPAPTNVASLRRTIGFFAYYAKWIANFSDKIRPLNNARSFPIPEDAMTAFENLKQELGVVTLMAIDEDKPFTVETDASDFSIAATLNQDGRPVAFFSRSLHGTELKRHSVEKEAQSIVEAIYKWRHFLLGRHFTLITDQRSVSFMYGPRNAGKIRNDRILRWRLELGNYSYDIKYRPGSQNAGPDTFTRVYCSAISTDSLKALHQALGHPGITRMTHFIRSKNLPYSIDDVKALTSACPTCAKCKPRFYKPPHGSLIKATQPFERLSIDFKGPLPSSSSSKNRYLLTVIDENSRFPFAYPCPDISTGTVIHCLDNLFSLFGMPSYTHSDRGPSFVSSELTQRLNSLRIATSRTTAYNPEGNGQCERYNGIIWKTVSLLL